MVKGFLSEAFIWVAALIFLALSEFDQHHFSLCPFFNLGISWCPGCGLGRALSHIFHGEFTRSLQQHWFGFPALGIISYRIIQLFHNILTSIHHQKTATCIKTI